MLLKENALRKERKLISENPIKYQYYYIFKCIGSNCTKEIKIQQGAIKSRTGKCMKCSHKGEPYKFIYNELLKTLKRRNKHQEDDLISFKEFLEIINTKKCHYCGENVNYNKHTRDNSGNHLSRAYQLDRKDNEIGYTKDNLVVCCWTCNRLKSNEFSYDEFMKLSPILKKIKLKRKKMISIHQK